MKLRIKGDSLRLRVSRSELDRFLKGERIEDTVHFGPAPDAKLTYALEFASDAAAAAVRYNPQEVVVVLTTEQSRAWSDADQTGVYTTLDIAPNGQLELAIEKDFACLDRSDEENEDTFINPHAGTVC